VLQPPFFSAAHVAARNFGALGTIVGHELTHGFDDVGRRRPRRRSAPHRVHARRVDACGTGARRGAQRTVACGAVHAARCNMAWARRTCARQAQHYSGYSGTVLWGTDVLVLRHGA
jgi:hypothetical protein